MKRAFLYAYDKVNLGDDLFVRTILKHYPKTKFYIWSDRQNKVNFSDMKNLTVIDYNSLFVRTLNRLRPSLVVRYKTFFEKKSDVVIYIGGSIFMQYDPWEEFANWWEYEAENRSLYVIGANFGPYQTEDFRIRFNRIFSKLHDICFRDKYSFDQFSDVEMVRYAPDILFSAMGEFSGMEKKKSVFVSPINCNRKGKDELCLSDKESVNNAELERICRFYIEDGYSVTLSSFCKEEGDEEIVKRIYDELASTFVEVLNYNGKNLDDIMKRIASSEYVIGERFHAVVLGLAAGCQVLPVIYSDKTKNILKDLGFSGQMADIRTMKNGDINYHLLRKSSSNQTIPDIERISGLCLDHFKVLDEVLGE